MRRAAVALVLIVAGVILLLSQVDHVMLEWTWRIIIAIMPMLLSMMIVFIGIELLVRQVEKHKGGADLTGAWKVTPPPGTQVEQLTSADVAELAKLLDKNQTGEDDQEAATKGGRPSFPENNWAYQQVNELKRDKMEIFREWCKLRESREKESGKTIYLDNQWDSFKKVIKPKKK